MKNSGNVAMYVLLAVIIFAAFLMVGGAQKFSISPPSDLKSHEVDTSAKGNTPNNSIQMNSLKFKP